MEQRVKTKNISFFPAPIWGMRPKEKVSLVDICILERSDIYKDRTFELRSIEDGDAARNFKEKNMDSITPSGVFPYKSDDGMKYHSEFICIDIDHLESEDKLQEVKQKLIDNQRFYTLYLKRSPSGDGLKWFIPINLSKCGHRIWFIAIKNWLYKTYALEADEKCINVSRSCFLNYDPESYACPEITNCISNL